MLIEVKVPVLAESIADATLLEWRRQPGEPVQRGENLVDLETDKVTLEVTAPDNGVLKEIRKAAGSTAVSQEVLAIIDTEAKAAAVIEAATATAGAAKKKSPAVRKLAAEHGLDTAAVATGTKDDRITKADIVRHIEAAPAAAISSAPAAVRNEEPSPGGIQFEPPGGRAERRVPMSRLRRRAAERLLEAQRDNAILTTFNEVNMAPVMELRERHRDIFQKAHGVKLGYMAFFVKAAVAALGKFPIVNASVDGSDIVHHDYHDIGVAVGSERGLVVPVLRDADQLSFADIEKAIADFGMRAKDGKLTLDELTGGTFTITNGGVFGSLLSTPIINPPQSAILGMHKIQERPVAESGAVVIRPMMYLALSYDHRIIDGREAVQFLVSIKDALEDPSRLLLGV